MIRNIDASGLSPLYGIQSFSPTISTLSPNATKLSARSLKATAQTCTRGSAKNDGKFERRPYRATDCLCIRPVEADEPLKEAILDDVERNLIRPTCSHSRLGDRPRQHVDQREEGI